LHIAVNALILVMCVIKGSLIRANLENINAYIMLNARKAVKCLISHSRVKCLLVTYLLRQNGKCAG